METLKKNIQQQKNKDQRPYPKLDYSITDIQQRNKIVYHIIETIPSEKLTHYYLEELTKYLTQNVQTKKEKMILTDNRMFTINKRETSYQGLVSKLENGQDGIYNFITQEDKNILLVPKISISEEDLETIPGLKKLREEIKKIEQKQKKATGKDKYLLTKMLIQMRQDQYVLKSAYKPPIYVMNMIKNVSQINLDDNITIDEDSNEPINNELISFFNPQHICCILCNYSKLKEACWGNFQSDMYYLMQAFDQVSEKALKQNYPILYEIMILKIDGLMNKDIIIELNNKFNITYSIEYLSLLWRKKIPKIIAEQAKQDWIVWYYTTKEYGKWKRCSRCHKIKLAHPYFFTKNKTSKDGFYSLCKKCRNKK